MEGLRNSLIFLVLMLALVSALTSISATNVTDQKQLSSAIQASSRYNNLDNTYGDGYVQTGSCVPGQGYYFVNYNKIGDGSINVLQPEVLLYEKTNHGLTFVGVQYVYLATSTSSPPTYFGHTFSGPYQGAIPNIGPYYRLNVWTRKLGPSGRFADYNSLIKCP